MGEEGPPIDEGRYDWGLAILQDVVPVGGNSIATALRKLVERRAEKARSILASELARKGLDLDVVAERDERFGALLRYIRAVRDGRSEANLRLMAQLLASQVVEPRFDNPTIESYLDILAELTEPEIRLVATLHRYCKERSADDTTVPFRRILPELVPAVLPSEDHAHAVAAKAARSGLLAFEPDTWGGPYYKTSAVMADLEALPLFQALMSDPFASFSGV